MNNTHGPTRHAAVADRATGRLADPPGQALTSERTSNHHARHRLVGLLLVAIVCVAALSGTTAATAHATPAPVPCWFIGANHYECDWYRPGNGINGGSPVVRDGAIVGYLHQGRNWITCQQMGSDVYNSARNHNVWYGWTLTDGDANHPSRWGWASALDAHGGADYGKFSGVPDCNGQNGSAPTNPGPWPPTSSGGGAQQPPPNGGAQQPACTRSGRVVTKFLSNRNPIGPDHSWAKLTWQPEFCRDGSAWRVSVDPTLLETGAGAAAGIGVALDAPQRSSHGVTYQGRIRDCLPLGAGYQGISYTGKLCNTMGTVEFSATIDGSGSIAYSFPNPRGNKLSWPNRWVWTDRLL